MKIKFVPTQQEIEATPDKTLLQLCTENQIEIKSICKGVPSCAECRIRVVEGEHNILPPSKAEMSLIGTNYFIDQRRLACQVRCFGDITVDLTEQIERSEIQSKKVRGFRAPGQKGSHVETQAKQGTLVLEEAPPKDQPRGDRQIHNPKAHSVESEESGKAHLQATEGQDHHQNQNRPQKNQQRRDRGPRPQNQQKSGSGGQNQKQGGGQRHKPRGGHGNNNNNDRTPKNKQ